MADVEKSPSGMSEQTALAQYEHVNHFCMQSASFADGPFKMTIC